MSSPEALPPIPSSEHGATDGRRALGPLPRRRPTGAPRAAARADTAVAAAAVLSSRAPSSAPSARTATRGDTRHRPVPHPPGGHRA